MSKDVELRRTSRKRLFLLCFLFSVLAICECLCIYDITRLPSFRFDPIPLDAYIVPWMRLNPPIEELEKSSWRYGVEDIPWDIDVVMADALKLNITFKIKIPNSTIVVPSLIYLGHDMELLYIGVKSVGILHQNTTAFLPNYLKVIFDVFFDADNDGKLTFPETGSRLWVFIYNNSILGWAAMDWVWTDYDGWSNIDCCYAGVVPAKTCKDMLVDHDNQTGTITILYSRFLRRSEIAEVNTMQIKIGERYVMGFLIGLGFQTEEPNNAIEINEYVDGWPKKFSYESNDSSWWPKLVIDLTNPPQEFL